MRFCRLTKAQELIRRPARWNGSSVIIEISSALQQQNEASALLADNTDKVAQMSGGNTMAAKNLLNLARGLESKATISRHQDQPQRSQPGTPTPLT